jgi:flagellar L-ring protein precursor FlgH
MAAQSGGCNMLRMTMVVLVLGMWTAVAAAQTTSRGPASQGEGERLAPPVVREAPLVAPGDRMAQTRGSLLRATQRPAHEPQATAADLERISFFAVPPPKPKIVSKHDLVTIIVREESESKHEGSTDLSKDMQFEAKVEEWIKLNMANLQLEGGPLGDTAPSVKLGGSRTFEGEGTAERSDSITARIQAEVVDVKPNGTLVLQARKTIVSDENEVRFILSGVARVEDITADNTILSTQIYDLELQKMTRGAVTASTKRGWVPKLLDFVNPF